MLPTKHGFALLESIVLRKSRLPHEDEKAREALIDCLLIMLEAADDLGLQKTAEYLDLAADFALSEVQSRRLSKSALTQFLRLSLDKPVLNDGNITEGPIFKSRRGSASSWPRGTAGPDCETTRLSA